MSNVIIQKINLYDLELQGNSSSDEEEENVAKNQQKQPLISNFLTNKPQRQARAEGTAEKVLENAIQKSFSTSSKANNTEPKTTKITSPTNKQSSPGVQKSAVVSKSVASTSTLNESSSLDASTSKTKSATATLPSPKNQITEKASKNSPNKKLTDKLPIEIVVKEENVEIEENPVVQQTWQDLDQHTFIKQENELMVPPDSLDGENIMEDEIEEQDLIESIAAETSVSTEKNSEPLNDQNGESMLENSELLNDGDLGILDEKFGFFYKGSEESHKNIEDSEDFLTSQDIPEDFEDDFEENPSKRMRIDENLPQNSNKLQANSIVYTLPKGITVKRTNSRQVACKSTSSVPKNPQVVQNPTSVSRNSEISIKNGPIMAKIGENLLKIGETFVKHSESLSKICAKNNGIDPVNSTVLTGNDQQFLMTAVKEEPLDDIPMETEYSEDQQLAPETEAEKSYKYSKNIFEDFTKMGGIYAKCGEISNRIVDRIITKRGEGPVKLVPNSSKVVPNAPKIGQTFTKVSEDSPKVGVSPTKFGLNPAIVGGNFVKVVQSSSKSSPGSNKILISTKVVQNSIKPNQSATILPSSSYFMPEDFLDVKIKEEKLDEGLNDDSADPGSFLETKIKEEQLDDFYSSSFHPKPSTVTSKPLNSSVLSTPDSIVSTKVVTLPASNLLKPRKIIVIKKPVTPGVKPTSGHVVQRALKSQLNSNISSHGGTIITKQASPGTGTMRYVVKTLPAPNTTVKIENNPKSTLQISSISSAQSPSSSVPQSPKTTTVTFPKSNTKIVVNQPDPIYRCQKCHLLFSSHSEYTEHLKEHKTGVILSERRVVKLEELRQMNAFQCAQCSAAFPTIEKLSSHENRHKTEFECKFCGKKFLQKHRYQEHIVLHEKKNMKYMECAFCDKKFLKSERLDEHIFAVHGHKETFACEICDKKYPTKVQLQEHQKIAHMKRIPMKCGFCHYETFIKQNFEKHASMHMRYVEKLNSNTFFKCDQCPQSFREMGVLEMHKTHMHSS